MEFSKQLVDLREERDLKQKELAEVIGLQSSAVSKYEKGITQPNLMTLVKLAEFFEVSVDYLLGVSSIRNPYSTDKCTPKEAEIITKYRRLSSENKIRIDERIRAMLDGQSQSS